VNSNDKIRIEKYLSEQGIASRREAQALIKEGYILLNGKKVTETGIKINPDQDQITLSEEASKKMKSKTTVMVYKPRGVICGKDDDGEKTIFDSFPQYKELNTVGRLDKDSEGLLLLSNDGMVTKAITDQSHPSEKEYLVSVREDVLPWMIKKFISGIKLEGGYKTLPAKSEKLSKKSYSITLREGKKHQIRRMANAVGLTITNLKRVRINDLKIGNMKPGQARRLNPEQIKSLRKLGATS